MRLIFLLAFLIASPWARAHTPKDGDIYATAGVFSYRTDPTPHYFESPYLLAPGLMAEADIGPHGGVELEVSYIRNDFVVGDSGRLFIERVKRMDIATGYRYWFKPWVSAGLLFSSTYAIGRAQVMRDDFQGAAHQGTSASDITEYGFDFSLKFEPWQVGRLSLVVDTHYNYSVTPKKGEDANHYGAFIGVKYFLQSREEKLPEAPISTESTLVPTKTKPYPADQPRPK